MKMNKIIIMTLSLLLVSLFAFGLPDAKFNTTITISPSTINSGDTVTITAIVKGARWDGTPFKVIGGIDGVTTWQQTYTNMAAGTLQTVSFTWTATGGSHVAFFTLDPDNTVTEANESNNHAEYQFTVQGGETPPPTQSVNLGMLSPINLVNMNGAPGETMTISAYLKAHSSAASNVKIEGGVNGVKIWDTTFTTVNKSETKSVSFDWTIAAGQAAFYFKVDPQNTITETNEGDNELFRTITVQDIPPPPPVNRDLKFNGNLARSPFAADAGDTQTISVQIYNINHPTDNIKVYGGIDGVKLWETTIAHMDAGEYKDISFPWTATEGSHEAYFTLDPDNTIAEVNETDNTLGMTFTVAAAPEAGPPAGLELDAYFSASHGLKMTPTGVISPGTSLHFWANGKLSGSTAVNLKLTGGVDGVKLYEKVYPAFPSIQGVFPAFDYIATPGPHKAWFEFDPDHTQNDTNRSNNRVELRFEVQEAPGIDIQDPCARTLKGRTDLRIEAWKPKAGRLNKSTAAFGLAIRNSGPKCVRMLKFDIMDNRGTIIKSYWIVPGGSLRQSKPMLPKQGGWLFKPNERIVVMGTILVRDVRSAAPCANNKGKIGAACAKLKVIIDPDDKIRETNESNNDSGYETFRWQ